MVGGKKGILRLRSQDKFFARPRFLPRSIPPQRDCFWGSAAEFPSRGGQACQLKTDAPLKKLFLKLLSLLTLYQSYNTCNKYQQSYQLSAGAIIDFTIYKHKHAEQYRNNKT